MGGKAVGEGGAEEMEAAESRETVTGVVGMRVVEEAAMRVADLGAEVREVGETVMVRAEGVVALEADRLEYQAGTRAGAAMATEIQVASAAVMWVGLVGVEGMEREEEAEKEEEAEEREEEVEEGAEVEAVRVA